MHSPAYQAVAASGIVLQIDCPDLAMGRPSEGQYAGLSLPEFRNLSCSLHSSALAQRSVLHPARQLRHCMLWLGPLRRPAHCDVPLADIIDIVFAARPAAISFEAPSRATPTMTLVSSAQLPTASSSFPA